MATLALGIGRDCMDDDGFWKQIRKWIQKRFPGWSF